MHDLTREELRLSDEAYAYVRANQLEIISKFASPSIYTSEESPVSLFMAGSPGAGKTETANALIAGFERQPIHIDADEVRIIFPSYDGSNAHIFQRAAVRGVDILFNYAIENRISLLLDGTFAYAEARKNIERSLRHNRRTVIYYVHQEPRKAWEVTKAREIIKQRKVPQAVFIRSTIIARENVDNIKVEFGDQVELNLILKDFETGFERFDANIPSIDPAIIPKYTEQELKLAIEKIP